MKKFIPFCPLKSKNGLVSYKHAALSIVHRCMKHCSPKSLSNQAAVYWSTLWILMVPIKNWFCMWNFAVSVTILEGEIDKIVRAKMFIGKLDFACNANVTAPFISNGPCTRSPIFLYAFFRIRHPFLSKCLLRMRKQTKTDESFGGSV